MKKPRPEKDFRPSETISSIQHILAQNRIETYENTVEHNGFFSTRLIVANEALLNLKLGTNGKGMTPEFSLTGIGIHLKGLAKKATLKSSISGQAAVLSTVPAPFPCRSCIRPKGSNSKDLKTLGNLTSQNRSMGDDR